MSDTHGHHRRVNIPDGDVLVHAGDITISGQLKIMSDFAEWMGSFSHKKKYVIFGNHDRFQAQSYYRDMALTYIQDAGITYLQDSEDVIDGVKFYGSPWTPAYGEYWFMASRGEDIAKRWNAIPDDVDVLITHSPPYDILDQVFTGEVWFGEEIIRNIGCEMLAKRIQQLKSLKAHIFGHCHPSSGVKVINDIVFANCAILNAKYEVVNPVRVIDI